MRNIEITQQPEKPAPNHMKLSSLLLISALVLAASNVAKAVVILGQPYNPGGDANFTITAVQGIDSSNPTGKTGFNPAVNKDFEFPNAIGVSYDKGNGTRTDFGIGLYAGPGNVTQSTGLRIDYTSLVTASSITVTVEDFDISAGKDKFFNPNKVEPTLLLLGANNTVFASANPTQLFSALSPAAGALKGDTWTLDFAKVLQNLNLADGQISGFILGADMANGEKPNSDPYLLVSVGNGIPVIPEADTYAVGLFGIAVAFASARKLKRRTSSAS